MATFRHRPQRYIRDFVTLVTMIMIYDLFDDDPSFELVGVLRSTRRVCVTIQDCVMSTENLERMYRYVYSGTDQNAIGRIHRHNISNEHPTDIDPQQWKGWMRSLWSLHFDI